MKPYPSFINKEDLQNLPLIRFSGDISVIDTPEALRAVLQQLSQEEAIGFDTETKPTFLKGQYHAPALIQLATLHHAYLVRVQKTGFTDSLIHFLENPRLKKIGISIRDDLKDLIKVRRFNPGGFVDLNHEAARLGVTQIGVKSLTGIFLGKRISKSQQTSNWENTELTKPQQDYAATDAWICLKIYDYLVRIGYL